MSNEVAAVSLNGGLWRPDMTTEVLHRMQDHLGIPTNFPVHSEIDALRVIANPGVRNRNRQVIHDIGRGAANTCVDSLNEQVASELLCLETDGYTLIAISSSPDFAVNAAVRKLRKEFGLNFSEATSTPYWVTKGKYEGRFRPQGKKEMLKEKLAQLHALKVEIAFVSEADSNQAWLKSAEHVVPVGA